MHTCYYATVPVPALLTALTHCLSHLLRLVRPIGNNYSISWTQLTVYRRAEP